MQEVSPQDKPKVCETLDSPPYEASPISTRSTPTTTLDSSDASRSPPIDSPAGASGGAMSEEQPASPETLETVTSENKLVGLSPPLDKRGANILQQGMDDIATPCRRRRIPPQSCSDRARAHDDEDRNCPEVGAQVQFECNEPGQVAQQMMQLCTEQTQEAEQVAHPQDIRADPLRSCSSPTPHVRFGQGQDDLPEDLRSYKLSLDDNVGGMPVCQGDLMIYDMSWGTVKPWTVLLFGNGFYAIARSGSVHSFAWSPFSLLALEDDQHGPSTASSSRCCFSLSILAHNMGFFFALNGRDAEAKRQRWMDGMALSLRTHTKSLFPPYALAVEPLKDNPSTARRIVAGYLLVAAPEVAGDWIATQRDSWVSVPYCELQAHCNGEGVFVMYESERCVRRVSSLQITATTFLKAKQGMDCSLFTVGHLHICARTVEERHIWHRAISNVQVKCFNCAPDPTREDLQNFRQAVLERVRVMEMTEGQRRMGVVSGPGPSLPEVAPKLGCQVGRVPQLPTSPPAPPSPAATGTKAPALRPVSLDSQDPHIALSAVTASAATAARAVGDMGESPDSADTPSLDQREEPEIAPEPRSARTEPLQPNGQGSNLACQAGEPSENFKDDEPGAKQRCQKPPTSQPGPGLHEPLWHRRPQADALQRATDCALDRMIEGQLSI